MFTWLFSKNKVKTNKVYNGFHWDHWWAFFGFETLNNDSGILLNTINQIIEKWDFYKIDRKYWIWKESYNNIDIKAIVHSWDMASCFPEMNSEISIQYENKTINIWAHVNGIEAQMEGVWKKTFGLNFFATDYLENKEYYKKNKELQMSLSAFAYVVKESEKLSSWFSEDMVGYMPSQQVSDSSVYDFIGKIIDFKEYSFKGIEWFIIKTKLINNWEDPDFFVLDIFVNKENMRVEKLEKDMKITGCFWLQWKISK